MPQTEKNISTDIKKEIENRVDSFNKKHLKGAGCEYYVQIRNKFIYVMRKYEKYDIKDNVCRLTYNGNLEKMNFAIFRYSTETYDAGEIFFDGAKWVDGTIEGAMKAGLKAYPIY